MWMTKKKVISIENGDLLDDGSHSFVVKIWLEETQGESGQAKWRGHVTHVLTGERIYFEKMGIIIDFIIPYLEEVGVKF